MLSPCLFGFRRERRRAEFLGQPLGTIGTIGTTGDNRAAASKVVSRAVRGHAEESAERIGNAPRRADDDNAEPTDADGATTARTKRRAPTGKKYHRGDRPLKRVEGSIPNAPLDWQAVAASISPPSQPRRARCRTTSTTSARVSSADHEQAANESPSRRAVSRS